MRTVLVVLGVAILGSLCASASADDFAPPPWRNAPLSVYVEWDFVPPMPPGAFDAGWDADVEIAVGGSHGETLKNFGDRTSHIDFDLATNWSWDGQDAITPTGQEGATMAANVVNWIDNELLKLIRVQVTYAGPQPDIIDGQVMGYEGEAMLPASLLRHVDVNPTQYYEDWRIVPNPDWEQIPFYVPFGTLVDQIVIDTISTPEPASLTLLALGFVGFLLARHR
jgi:hypothetical protein